MKLATADQRRDLGVDSALALLLVAVGIAGTWGAAIHRDPGEIPLDAWSYVLVIVAGVALTVRRLWPVVTLAITTLCTSIYLVLGYPYGPVLLSLLVAVYTVARYLPMRRAAVVAGVALVFLLLHVAVGRGVGPGMYGVAPGAAWVVVPFAVGVVVGLNREAAARARGEWARRHADEERLRVAREVHDVVGHGLSAIAMQAEIALHVLAKQPEQAEIALTAISRTSREALDELRVALALVRRDGDLGVGHEAEARAPLPGLASLDALTARMTDSGLSVRVETTGEAGPLPGSVDLTAYRVVQESLTNVLRHAGPSVAVVRISFGPNEVTVEVTDNGRGGSGATVEGHGIRGMRQRVLALGGTFTAAPVVDGFRVVARLPTP